MIEIERKFLVNSADFKQEASSKTQIVQGFLNKHPERTVRVRIKGNQGFLTIKGKGNLSGTTRFEWEKMIPKNEAESLLAICEAGTIDKFRYEVKFGKHIFEVDEFFGENEGLVMAEVELTSENDEIEFPHWIGKEVTGDTRFYNSQLSKNPYKNWKNEL